MESNRRFCFSWLIHLCIDDDCLYLHLYLTSVLGREPSSWGATPGFEAHLSEYVSNERLLKKHPEIKGIRHEKSQEPFLEHKFLESPQMDRSIFPSRSLFDIWLFFFFRETVRSFLLLDSYDKRAMKKNTNTPRIFPWMYPGVSYFPLWKSIPLDFHTVFLKLLCDIKIPPTNFNQSLLVWESDGNQGVISRPKGFLPLDLELELSRFRPLDGVLSCRKVFSNPKMRKKNLNLVIFWSGALLCIHVSLSVWFGRKSNKLTRRVSKKPSILVKRPTPEASAQICRFLFFREKWMFPKIGVPQNGWFIMENAINPWMICGYHYFRKHPNDQLANLSFFRLATNKLTGQTVLTLHSSVQPSMVPPSRQSCQLHAWGATVELKFSTVLAFWWDTICINKVVFLCFLGIAFVFFFCGGWDFKKIQVVVSTASKNSNGTQISPHKHPFKSANWMIRGLTQLTLQAPFHEGLQFAFRFLPGFCIVDGFPNSHSQPPGMVLLKACK